MGEFNKAQKILFKSYFKNCEKRNVFFGLTIEDFSRLTALPCNYCDKPPSQRMSFYHGYPPYSGLDRVNPKWGYTLENVVPCCADCNALKSNRLTAEETSIVGKALALFRAGKNK